MAVMIRIVAAILFLSAIAARPATAASERGLLWRVVQTCLVNHKLTGGAFPCLDVQTPNGRATGYAVLRAPLEKTHIVVMPTVRTIGIEAEALRAPDAPSYFHDAWIARHFVTDELPKKPGRTDIGMAVNSRPGRSQDQLHIHVNCLRPAVRHALAQQATASRTGGWTRLAILPHAPTYMVHDVRSEDLAGINVFQAVSDGLSVDPDDMDDVTIVVVGADDVHGAPGFTILARQRQPGGFDEAHGEALLDPQCRAFQ